MNTPSINTLIQRLEQASWEATAYGDYNHAIYIKSPKGIDCGHLELKLSSEKWEFHLKSHENEIRKITHLSF